MKIKDLIDIKTYEYNWDYIESIPEFNALKNCEQSPKWHSEGNAWIHTKMVCEQAINFCNRLTDLTPNERLLLLSSALFHDIGKPSTTFIKKDGDWHSYGHEFESDKITRLMLWDEACKMREDICALVKNHMIPLNLFNSSKHFYEDVIKLSKEVPNMKLLCLLKLCDIEGSIPVSYYDKNIDKAKMSDLISICTEMNCYNNSSSLPLIGKEGIYGYYMRNKLKPANVYVMIGLPGAGKSTIIEKIAKENNLDDYAVISRDIIRAKLGYCKMGEKIVGTSTQEENVTLQFNKDMCDAIIFGKSVFIDNINLKRKYRDGYHAFLKDFEDTYNIIWNYVYVETKTLSNNMKRREKDGFNQDIFINMIKNFDWPTFEEYDTIKIYENE